MRYFSALLVHCFVVLFLLVRPAIAQEDAGQQCLKALQTPACQAAGEGLGNFLFGTMRECGEFRDCKKDCRGVKKDCKSECRQTKASCMVGCKGLKGKAKRQCRKSCRGSARQCKDECQSTKKVCKTTCKNGMPETCRQARNAINELVSNAPECIGNLVDGQCDEVVGLGKEENQMSEIPADRIADMDAFLDCVGEHPAYFDENWFNDAYWDAIEELPCSEFIEK